jgi:hypothetical protein
MSSHAEPATMEGLKGYAIKQAAIRVRMLQRCEEAWGSVAEAFLLGAGVPADDMFRIELH